MQKPTVAGCPLRGGNLKSLKRSLARSKGGPEVGYAGDDPPLTLGSSTPLWGRKTGCSHRGLACLLRVWMKTKGGGG